MDEDLKLLAVHLLIHFDIELGFEVGEVWRVESESDLEPDVLGFDIDKDLRPRHQFILR